MARVADVAMTLINMSIRMAKDWHEEMYYMNFVKMRQLLVIAQILFMREYGTKMFEEPIRKTEQWRIYYYIDGTSFVPKEKGFGLIKEGFDEGKFIRPSYSRCKMLEEVLEMFGMCDEDILVLWIAIVTNNPPV